MRVYLVAVSSDLGLSRERFDSPRKMTGGKSPVLKGPRKEKTTEIAQVITSLMKSLMKGPDRCGSSSKTGMDSVGRVSQKFKFLRDS